MAAAPDVFSKVLEEKEKELRYHLTALKEKDISDSEDEYDEKQVSKLNPRKPLIKHLSSRISVDLYIKLFKVYKFLLRKEEIGRLPIDAPLEIYIYPSRVNLLVRLLYDKTIKDKQFTNEEYTLLITAVLELGADPNKCVGPVNQFQPLQFADKDTFKLLLKCGANPCLPNPFDCTPFDILLKTKLFMPPMIGKTLFYYGGVIGPNENTDFDTVYDNLMRKRVKGKELKDISYAPGLAPSADDPKERADQIALTPDSLLFQYVKIIFENQDDLSRSQLTNGVNIRQIMQDVVCSGNRVALDASQKEVPAAVAQLVIEYATSSISEECLPFTRWTTNQSVSDPILFLKKMREYGQTMVPRPPEQGEPKKRKCFSILDWD